MDERGGLRLAAALAHPPAAWDGNGNGQWEGYTQDCWFQPDSEGFDRSPDGAMTGWRAFAYAPFPGMFWPTNGSAGDVFIRLPAAFRRDPAGRESTAVYRLNLAILEAYIRRVDVPLPPTDERELGSDSGLQHFDELGKRDGASVSLSLELSLDEARRYLAPPEKR